MKRKHQRNPTMTIMEIHNFNQMYDALCTIAEMEMTLHSYGHTQTDLLINIIGNVQTIAKQAVRGIEPVTGAAKVK